MNSTAHGRPVVPDSSGAEIRRVPLPAKEDERLAALWRYGILDSPPEPGFDRITALAARLFGVPVCIVSLVDEYRVWFKSRVGWTGEQVDRQESLCSFAVLQENVLVIHDARQEERFACNTWVRAEPGIRFYAGAPLITPEGFNLGTLCLIDTQPRERFDAEDRQTLADLAAMVVDEMELHLSLQRTVRTAAALAESEHCIGEQNRVLEMIAAGTTCLNEMLDGIVHFIEAQTEGTVLCSVMLLDEPRKCLYYGSAPNLPETYSRAIDGIAIGPEVGSCGSAAYRNETVVVTDITTDPKWEGLRTLALAHQLLACWSTPIRNTRSKVLGTLAMYYRTARGPDTHEQKMVAAGADMAAIAIERWYAAETLAGSEQRYRLLTESIPQLVWTSGDDGMLNDVNPQWLAYTGLSLEQVRKVGWQAVVHPEDVLTLREQWAAAVEARTVYRAEGRLRRADGNYRWHLHRAVPQLDAHGQLITWFGTATDIEEYKRLEAEREQLLELEQQARAAAEAASLAKDRFLAMLSHELRTPLNPIIGWTQLLRRGKLAPEARANALEVIERNAKLQNQLIEDLLDVSRIEQGKFSLRSQPLSPERIVHGAVETVRSLAHSTGVVLKIQAAADLPLLSADPTRLTQVVWNLLTNAIKFTPRGGWVSVRLEATVEVVRIEVSDSGIGISPAFLPWLFERFRQASEGSTRTQGGLGLGLFIVRHIVEAHGGRVWAASAGEGQGATFTVELPAVPPPVHLPGEHDLKSGRGGD